MAQRITATEAKNNFGGLLDLVAARGRVEITKHGRVVAVILAPDVAEERLGSARGDEGSRNHMISKDRARAARVVRAPEGFDDP